MSERQGERLGLKVASESYVDRAYDDSGEMRSREMPDAMITDPELAASQVLRFGSNLVLTRLLFPEAFGLMAIALVPRRREFVTVLLTDVVAVLQIVIAWGSAFSRDVVLTWMDSLLATLNHPGIVF